MIHLEHSAGDELICAASNCMKFAFASYGKVYRISGDEFVVLIQESVSNIDSILQVFDVTIHDLHGKYSNSISVSYGVVKSSEQDFDSVQELSKLADERMYQNKRIIIQRVVMIEEGNEKASLGMLFVLILFINCFF
ncbi:MAG: diguanylate cyclase domain-containing protein [Holdemanella porci]